MDFFEKEPGVYVTDEQQDAPVASGSSVGTLLFLGVTESGPVEGDVEVTDFNTWTRIFGDFVSDTHDLYKQVKKAFLNGAKKVRTKRVVHYTDPTDASTCTALKATGSLTDSESTLGTRITVTARYEGAREIIVKTAAASNSAAECFDLEVWVKGIRRETYKNLSEDKASEDYFVTVVNSKSYYIVLADSATNTSHVKPAQSVTLSGGNDGLSGLDDDDFLGDEIAGTGVHAFNTYMDTGILVCTYADQQETVILRQGLLLWLKNIKPLNFGIMVVPKTKQNHAAAVEWMTETFTPDERRAAMYGPYLIDSDDGKAISPAGAIAGLFAAWGNDAMKGIWQNMAGTDAVLYGFSGVVQKYSATQAGKMNENNINVIKSEAGTGIYINGSRTMTRSQVKRFRYIGQSLNTSDIMRRIEKNTAFAAHKHIDDLLKSKVKLVCNSILDKRFRDGGFAGASSAEAYRVTHDVDTDTLANEGIFLTKVGIRNKKTAEFVWFNVYDLDGSISVSE